MVALAERKTTPSASKQKLRLWLSLLKTSRHIETEVRERFRKEFGTTLPRFDALAALDRHNHALKMSELSRALKVSNGNVTVIVDSLVADGHVMRINLDGDRRASLVQLTKKGAAFFAEMAKRHEAWIDELIGSNECEDYTALTSALRKLIPDEG